LLLTFANAMQPGIFCLSSWDLVGALPLPRATVEKRLSDGDYRWINRGAIDLLGNNPDANTSSFGLPRTRTLYAALPEQLKDPNSFAMQLKRILAARKKYQFEQARLVAVPETDQSSSCVLIFRVSGRMSANVTAINFSRDAVEEEIDLHSVKELSTIKFGGNVIRNCITDADEGMVDAGGKLKLKLEGWSGKAIAIDAKSKSED
jgi:hypothetical protein